MRDVETGAFQYLGKLIPMFLKLRSILGMIFNIQNSIWISHWFYFLAVSSFDFPHLFLSNFNIYKARGKCSGNKELEFLKHIWGGTNFFPSCGYQLRVTE